jgi:hypothetical protein
MPGDPVDFVVWKDLKASLGRMRKAEGFHLDYGEVLAGARSLAINDSDYVRPKVGIRWLGEVSEHPIYGSEMATHTMQRNSQFEITIPAQRGEDVPNDDSTERAFRIKADVHSALMSSIEGRTRGLDNATTYESQIEWRDRDEMGTPIGGVLFFVYTVRFRHQTGDASLVR